jgi:hypothetical protein
MPANTAATFLRCDRGVGDAQAFWGNHVTVEQPCPKPLSGVLADRHRHREAAIVQGLTSPVGSKRLSLPGDVAGPGTAPARNEHPRMHEVSVSQLYRQISMEVRETGRDNRPGH